MSKKFDYICLRCHKKKQSTDPRKLTCNKCLAWNKPGIGQISFLGGVVEK